MRSLSHEKKPEVRNRVSLYHLSFDTKIVIETRFLVPERSRIIFMVNVNQEMGMKLTTETQRVQRDIYLCTLWD